MTATALDLSLTVRQTIKASPAFLFAAWTEPEHLQRWWGPAEVQCIGAELDLREGGRYRIGNRFPDGREVWITGAFEQVSPPDRLIYSWSLEDGDDPAENSRVTVSFNEIEAGTEVIVLHESIPSEELQSGHEVGWHGCLDGLVIYTAAQIK